MHVHRIATIAASLCFLPRAVFAQCPAEWTQVNVTGPGPRYAHAMAFDAARGVVVQFGGLVSGSSVSGATWTWNGTAWSLASTTGPGPRQGHAMAYDPIRQRVVVFGGEPTTGGGGLSTPTWEWNGASWTQAATTGPQGRMFPAMAFDQNRNKIVMFGGRFSSGTESNETWEWDGTAWSLVPATSPPASRSGIMLASDSLRNKLVVFGGEWNVSGGVLRDTWDFNSATAWSTRSNDGPSERRWYAMSYDANRDRTVLFGGEASFTRLGETWEWNDSAWTRRLIPEPPPRRGHAMAFDPIRKNTVMYGGIGASFEFYADTWLYSPAAPPAITSGPNAVVTCPTRVFSLSVAVTSSVNPSYQWRKNTQPILGATTSSYGDFAGFGSAGSYDCVVTSACGTVTSSAATVRVLPDLTFDGRVDVIDLTTFLGAFGATVTPFTSADFNGDGVVNVQDLTIFLGAFGAACL